MERLARFDGRPGYLGADLVSIAHSMDASGLFADQALQRLIERYPRHSMVLYALEPGGDRDAFPHRGDVADLSGAQILETIAKGAFRLELRGLEHHAPLYGHLIEHGFEDIERATPRLKTLNRRSTLVISSPRIVVPCRAAFSLVCKWQVRGRRRLHFYGTDQDNPLTPKRREAMLLAARTARVSFPRAWWPKDLVYALGPGMAVSWPLNLPHRIESEDELSVSIATEFMTPEARRIRDVHLANAFMRRRLGMIPQSTRTEGMPALFKRGLAAMMTGFGTRVSARPEGVCEFRLDPPANTLPPTRSMGG